MGLCGSVAKEEKENEMKSGKAKIGFLAGILVLLFIAVPAMAEQKKANPMNISQKFNIDSGSLEEAMDNYSKVTGIKTVYLNDLVAGKESPGVQGIYSPEAAVKKMLKGSGLTYQVTAENTVVLKENKTVVTQREAEEREEVKRPKREENVQDVPMSISVFSDIQLEDADIRDTVELTRFTPNVYVRHATAENKIVIRGISGFMGSLYSPAGFYVDDVNFPLNFMHNPDLFDIERVEVLKGPQGTLYGRNSESGVINIITKQPDNELRGKIFGEYGNYDTSHGNIDSYRTGGSISGPIIRDKLYLRLTGQWEDSDGFMENEYNDDDEAGKIDHLNGRGTLRWTPTDRWDISFIADAMDTDDNQGYARFLDGPLETDRHRINYDFYEYYWEQEDNGQNLRVKYEGDLFNLLSVTGRRDYELKLANDTDVGPFPTYGSHSFKWEDDLLSQEVRISSPSNHRPFEWLAGLYGFEEEADIDYKSQMIGNRKTDIDIQGYAVFGQGTYTLFDRLHLTAGLRYDYIDLEGDQTYEFIDMMGNPQSIDFGKDFDDDEFLPKFSIAYDFTDNIMTYASVSEGYLAGGYHYTQATSEENFTYDPEYTWNYEVGTKTSWLNNKLMANLSAFYIDIKDKQVSEFHPTLGVPQITNAAEAHSMGVELELQARPMQGLDVFAGFGYTEAKIDDWTATEMDMITYQFVTYDYENKYLPNVPKYTYNLGVQYRHKIGFFGRVDLLGTGSFYNDAKNRVKEDGYELVNLRLGYEREHFDIIFWCKNVFDEEYETVKIEWGPSTVGMDGEPRMLGATVTYRF
jgi:iron complex outermembrane receptor protein